MDGFAGAVLSPGRWRRRMAANLGAAVYGTVITTGVIAATSGDGDVDEVLATTAATIVVFWLAHVYAEVLARALDDRHRPRLASVRRIMRRELPMIEAPLVLLGVLLLGAVGVIDGLLAIELALWGGVGQLAAWGALYARQLRRPWPLTVLTALVNGGLGGLVILLKVLVT